MAFVNIIGQLVKYIGIGVVTYHFTNYCVDYVQRKYPEQFQKYAVGVAFKFLYAFSKCQIIYNKLCNYITTKPLSDTKVTYYDIIYKNKIVESYYLDISTIVPFKFNKDNLHIATFDGVNRVILQSKPTSMEYEVSDIQFLSIDVILENVDEPIEIKLKTEKANFYMVNNKFDLKFFKFYLKQYNHTIDNLDKITIEVLDNNFQFKEFEITNEKFIIIQKDKYDYVS